MKKILCLTLCLILCFGFCITVSADNNELKFDKNGEFKILVLSDTQDDKYPSYDMLNLIKEAIKNSSPDLIVFTGDFVEDSRIGDFGIDDMDFFEGVNVENIFTGEINHEKTLSNLTAAADNVLSVFQSSGVPFVIAMGNNDYKCSVSADEWLEIFSKYSNCLTFDNGIKDDNRIDNNYFIYGNDGEVKFNLWLMDTGRGGLSDEQIEWYKNKSSEITTTFGHIVPAIMFQHIHLDDIGNLFEECSVFDKGAMLADGKFYRLNTDIAYGYNFLSYAPCEATSEFKALKECGDVLGIYFGHQHNEGFTGTYDGIEMGFTYGCEFAKAGPYGYRVITLHEDDIKNYDNDVYVYDGSVLTDNVTITKQENVEQVSFLQHIFDIANIYIVKFMSMLEGFSLK